MLSTFQNVRSKVVDKADNIPTFMDFDILVGRQRKVKKIICNLIKQWKTNKQNTDRILVEGKWEGLAL